VAERERERAHDPQAVREPREGDRLVGHRARDSRFDREQLDVLLRTHCAETLLPEPGASVAHPSPLLARPEVVDVAEEDVPHPLPCGHGDREREEGDAALRVHRAVDRIDEHANAVGAERALAELLGHEVELVARLVKPLQSLHDRRLGGFVDRGRLVAADALSDDRLAVVPRRELAEDAPHVLDRLAAEGEPGLDRGHGSSGWKSRPDSSLG
jgi:hypothetical protein